MEGAGTAGGRVFQRKLRHWGYALEGEIGTSLPPLPFSLPILSDQPKAGSFSLSVPLP